MKFNKKEIDTIIKVLELEDLEPENTHLYIYVIEPLYSLYENYKYKSEEGARYKIEHLCNELSGYGYEKCRKRMYNRRLKALRTVMENKLEKLNRKG